MNQRAAVVLLAVVAALSSARASQLTQIPGAPCVSPPPLHCPRTNCPSDLLVHRGHAVMPRSGRAFFLDYPCDLQPSEAVTLILNLHGAGSYGNWQRHYFPIVDVKDKYRLVIATPSSLNSLWDPERDDAHLQRIVEWIYERFGAKNIKAFWLAGHSQGGQVAQRLAKTRFHRERLTGWVSLSGGRLGSRRAYVPADAKASYLQSAPASQRVSSVATDAVDADPGVGLADALELPDYPFSFIYTSGEYEMTVAGLPQRSPWARKLGCGPRTRRPDVVDTRPGYVWDPRLPLTRRRIAGRQPRPGRAQVFTYGDCADGRLVADVVRLDKGHTEGLEPNVTEAILRLMLSSGTR